MHRIARSINGISRITNNFLVAVFFAGKTIPADCFVLCVLAALAIGEGRHRHQPQQHDAAKQNA